MSADHESSQFDSSPSQGVAPVPEIPSASDNGESPQASGVDPEPQLNSSVAPLTPAASSAPADGQEGNGLVRQPDTLVLPQGDTKPSLPSTSVMIGIAIAVLFTGFWLGLSWLTLAGSVVGLVLCLRLLQPPTQALLAELTEEQRTLLFVVPATGIFLFGLMRAVGINQALLAWGRTIRWDVLGALGDFLGAFGQILIAVIAVYVAWRQYVISRDLTTQQNLITQQQTIDSYFQGISELVLDDEGLLEDWPQERIIAEARTAAILGSIDAGGKAKVIRFLSRSRLLTPLKRDGRLGRPIFDGSGGYEEDRAHGTRVIDLGAMLAGADLNNTDLRWTELSDLNLVRANLQGCDLARANLARTILYQANLAEADLMNVRLFYGRVETASPRSRTDVPNYLTGEYTGTVVEDADFSGVHRLSEVQRRYCCAWGGSKTRSTIPGGCDDIPNLLGR